MPGLKRSYDDIKSEKHVKLTWSGENRHTLSFTNFETYFQRDRVRYDISIVHLGTIKNIEILCDKPVELDKLYLMLGKVRRFECLFDGAFFYMEDCHVDDEDITAVIRTVEVGYFQSAKALHRIPIELTDREYRSYFSRWESIERQNGIINQMILYAKNETSLPSDVRLAMLAESYNMFAKKLEKNNLLSVTPGHDKYVTVQCQNCGSQNQKMIKGRKTLACCLTAVIEQYGGTVFSTEFRRRKSLIGHIVKTRNKVFHVDDTKKGTLNGGQCGFYSIKMDWLYRYIVLRQLGFDDSILNCAVSRQIEKFEEDFPQLIYKA